MTSSNLVGCTTGRSAGFAPLQDKAGIAAGLWYPSLMLGAVAHEPAGLDEVAREIDRRHGAIGRRAHQPLSQVDQEGIIGDQQRARSARRRTVAKAALEPALATRAATA